MATQKVLNSPAPHEINADYFKSVSVEGALKGKEKFTFNVNANGICFPINIAFPVLGGVRIFSNNIGFFTADEVFEISYSECENGVVLSAGENTAVYKNDCGSWSIEIIKEKKTLLSISSDNLLFGFAEGELEKIDINIERKENELFYGSGERYNSFFLKDEILLWNADGYRSGNPNEARTLSYINTPFFHSTAGYSLFYNSTYCGVADFSEAKMPYYSIDMWGTVFDIFVFTKSAAENIVSYTDLTGKPCVPPRWAFTYWAGGGKIVWEMNGLSIIPDIIRGWIDEYKDMKAMPGALFGEGEPSFTQSIYDYLNSEGVRMLMWNYSGDKIADVENWVGSTDINDVPIIRQLDNPDKYYENYADFTHPNIVKATTKKYEKYWDWGLKGAMIDFGEYVDPKTIMANGKTGYEMHNLHAYFYNKAHHDAWSKRLGNDYVLFARAGCAGSQRWAPNFTGDQSASFLGLEEQVNAVMSASASGFSIIGGDIGGFFTQPSFDVYCRWLQFAAFTPLMRAHGCPTGRNPWEWGDNGRNIFKAHYFMRENLMNLIYATAEKSEKTGIPMVKPFAVAFPENSEVFGTEGQYMFCDSVMCAPVTKPAITEWSVMFPKGTWYNIWSGEAVKGENKAVSVPVTYDRSPTYFKAGLGVSVRLGESLRLADTVTEATAVNALLITPPDTYTEIIYENSVIGLSKSETGMTLTAIEGELPEIILIHGFAVNKAEEGGKELKKYEELTDKVGFWQSGNNSTVIRLPQKATKIAVE